MASSRRREAGMRVAADSWRNFSNNSLSVAVDHWVRFRYMLMDDTSLFIMLIISVSIDFMQAIDITINNML